MSSTNWTIGLSGNWTTTADWTGGIPNGGSDVLINAFGTYTVTLSTAGNANSLTVSGAGITFSELNSGALNIANALTISGSKVFLRHANTIGSVVFAGGLLETANDTALGTGTLAWTGGELLGLVNETMANQLVLSGNLTIAAADGTTLNENASSWSYNATTPGSITFGQGGNDGTILWHTASGSITNPGHVAVEVATGTLKGGDPSFGFLFENDSQTKIDATGILDLAGFGALVNNLQGNGTITSATAATLSVMGGGNFAGILSGALALETTGGSLILSRNQTYTGGTTIDASTTLQIGAGATTGAVTGNIVDNGSLIYDRSDALNITAGISGTGSVTFQDPSLITINRGETFSGGANFTADEVSTNNGAAFGTGTLTLQDAELLATNSITPNFARLTMSGSSTVAAAHGKNLTINGPWTLDGGSVGATLNIGQGGNDGVVLWATPAGCTIVDIAQDFVEVHAGTFRGLDSSFAFLLENVGGVTVDAGAVLDLAGFAGGITGLMGAGSVTNHGAASTEIDGGDFAGVISGATALIVDGGLILTGANTFTGGTTIDASSALSLGDGGTTGSVVGNILDNGTLIYDRSDAVNITAGISGSGALALLGTGTTTIDRNETYTGGTNVDSGTLSINVGGALGTGALSLQDSELIGTATLPLADRLSMSGHVTIAAATGTLLTLNTATGWNLDATLPSSLAFGDDTNKGVILWHTPAGSGITNINHYTVDIHSGVLKAADTSLGFLLDNASTVTVEAGAAVNFAGFDNDIANLAGAGQITSTGGTFSVEAGNFSGTLTGTMGVDVYEAVTLSGSGTFAGGFTLEAGAQLDLSGVWAENLTFASPGVLVLHTPGQYSGHLELFAAGDSVDIRGVDFTSVSFSEAYNAATGVLTLGDGTHTQHVTFDGTYVLGNFTASGDGHAGTTITFAASEIPPMLASDYHVPLELG